MIVQLFKEFILMNLLVKIVLLLSFGLMITTFTLVARDNKYDEEYLGYVTKLRLLSQQITQQASLAARGNKSGFESLTLSLREYNSLLKNLTQGTKSGMAGTPSQAMPALTVLTNWWATAETNTQTSIQNLLKTQEAVTGLYRGLPELQKVTVDLVEKTEEMIKTMISGEATQAQIYQATRQLLWLERIAYNIRKSFINDPEEAVSAQGQVDDAISQFGDTLTILISGSEEDMPIHLLPVSNSAAQGVIEELQTLFEERIESEESKVGFFLEKSEALYDAKEALQVIMKLNPKILDSIEKLQTAYVDASKQRLISPFLGNVLAVVVLVLLLVLGFLIIRFNQMRALEAKQRLDETEENTQRNQEMILRLLSEISELADGDLTVNATVTKDFTDAIVDTINFSIKAIRDLVVKINKTAAQTTTTAQNTRKIATQLPNSWKIGIDEE